eukprot:gene28647-35541_t
MAELLTFSPPRDDSNLTDLISHSSKLHSNIAESNDSDLDLLRFASTRGVKKRRQVVQEMVSSTKKSPTNGTALNKHQVVVKKETHTTTVDLTDSADDEAESQSMCRSVISIHSADDSGVHPTETLHTSPPVVVLPRLKQHKTTLSAKAELQHEQQQHNNCPQFETDMLRYTATVHRQSPKFVQCMVGEQVYFLLSGLYLPMFIGDMTEDDQEILKHTTVDATVTDKTCDSCVLRIEGLENVSIQLTPKRYEYNVNVHSVDSSEGGDDECLHHNAHDLSNLHLIDETEHAVIMRLIQQSPSLVKPHKKKHTAHSTIQEEAPQQEHMLSPVLSSVVDLCDERRVNSDSDSQSDQSDTHTQQLNRQYHANRGSGQSVMNLCDSDSDDESSSDDENKHGPYVCWPVNTASSAPRVASLQDNKSVVRLVRLPPPLSVVSASLEPPPQKPTSDKCFTATVTTSTAATTTATSSYTRAITYTISVRTTLHSTSKTTTNIAAYQGAHQ